MEINIKNPQWDGSRYLYTSNTDLRAIILVLLTNLLILLNLLILGVHLIKSWKRVDLWFKCKNLIYFLDTVEEIMTILIM